eukprot:1155671-Pelagomonas_calceolata.AAC.1
MDAITGLKQKNAFPTKNQRTLTKCPTIRTALPGLLETAGYSLHCFFRLRQSPCARSYITASPAIALPANPFSQVLRHVSMTIWSNQMQPSRLVGLSKFNGKDVQEAGGGVPIFKQFQYGNSKSSFRLSVEPTNGPCHTSMYPPEIGQNGPGGAYVQLA